MFREYLIVAVLFVLSNLQRIESIQCYKCGCFVIPGETTCREESELNCVIQYVENNYCYILRTAGDIEFGHNSNADLVFLESLHYIRATEEFTFSDASSTWQTPKVTQVSYGCDWNLCNSPKILDFLPAGLSFDVSTQLLSQLFVPGPTESLTSCLSCSQSINSISDVNCTSTPCTGSCLIDDHIDDPQYNDGTYVIVYESVCTGDQPLPTTVHIKGNYYLDDRIQDITEIDIYCRKNNCNSILNAKAVQQNTTITTQLSNQLFFRPTVIATTPSTPNSQLIECYVCRCTQEAGANNCLIPQCTTEFRNASYCEIVRDRSESPDLEIVTLGHILKAGLQYPHYIYAVEGLELYANLTWNPPSVSLITYVCDWTLCNDPRIIDKLVSSFQFNVNPTEIAQYIQGSRPLSSCLQCEVCTNNTGDFSKCVSVGCPANGYCFIEQYIDDPQYNDCEYAFVADCEPDTPGSSMIIGATYSIDDDILDIDQFDLYCSLNDCNSVTTVNALKDRLLKDIRLDPLFFIRPVVNTTTTTTTTTRITGSSDSTTTTTTTTAIPGTTPSGAAKNYFTSLSYLLLPLTFWLSNRL